VTSPCHPPLTIDLLSVPSKATIEVETDITGLKSSETGLTATIGIKKNNENLKSLEPINFSNRHASAVIPVAALAPGDYEITASVTAPDGSTAPQQKNYIQKCRRSQMLINRQESQNLFLHHGHHFKLRILMFRVGVEYIISISSRLFSHR